MLKNRFDPTLPLAVALYLRMSTDQQNPRSPDQQRDTIDGTVRRCGYPWNTVREYIDAAVSGRYSRKRPEFQRMLREIRSGVLVVDAILVDTFERFGRADECAQLRQDLCNRHGVLVLTADTQFADPTSVAGRALSAFEQLRATEENRIKAHNVLRGKRDTARLGHWPGGKPPFGYKLESVLVNRNGRQEVDHCILVPDPASAWIIQRLFNMARERGWGSTRLARMLNKNPEIPQAFKPFFDQTVNYWLSHSIYHGELLWEQHSTGVIDDCRIIQRNTDDEVLRVPNFCEPLVSRELWSEVQQVREARSERARQAREARRNRGKQIAAASPGLALRYLLSGLVCCGHCRRSMVANASSPYTTKAGETRRYASYVCPGYLNSICPNAKRVPEEWLRQTVVGLIRQRLFSGEGESPWCREALERTDWFHWLVAQVQQELDRLAAHRDDLRPALQKEWEDLQTQVRGWSQSLAKPDLSSAVRELIEGEMTAAVQRQHQLQGQLAEANAVWEQTRQVVDTAQVVDRLNRLADVLAAHNPTAGNLELSLHIETIACFQDGRVVVRTCKLGALSGAVALLASPASGERGQPSETKGAMLAKPRRRTRRRIDDDSVESRSAAHTAADVERFAGLDPEWFWEDTFQVPRKQCWAEQHAAEVADQPLLCAAATARCWTSLLMPNRSAILQASGSLRSKSMMIGSGKPPATDLS